MRRIEVYRSFGVVRMKLSEWRKIRRVLRAAEAYLERPIATEHGSYALRNAIDALNKQPKK